MVLMNAKIAELNAPVVVEVLHTRYPQGAEKQLVQAVSGRQVPSGKLPADAGCCIFNLNTTCAIYRAVYEGMPVVNKIVTVSGSGVIEPKNIECPIGTPITKLFDACGGLKDETYKLIMGGPMMGLAQYDVHEAEELMLDVFAYLFTKKPRIQDGGFKAYLYKAARHMALRHKSKRKPLFSLDALTGEPDGRLLAEEVIRTEERNRILHFCMDEMNPDYREVLYLTYFEDMSYAQAAEVTGKTVKQITNMVYRGKESLRRLLEREGITNAES